MHEDVNGLQFDFTADRSGSARQVRVLKEFHAHKLSPEASTVVCLAVLRAREWLMQQEVTNMIACINRILAALKEGGATEQQLDIWKGSLYQLQRDSRLAAMSPAEIEEILIREATRINGRLSGNDIISKQGNNGQASIYKRIGKTVALVCTAVFVALVISISSKHIQFKSKSCSDESVIGPAQYVQFPDRSWAVILGGTNYCTPTPFFTNNRRELSITDGSLYLDVAKNAQLPFVVKTAQDVEIEVLGTGFRVDANPKDGFLTVSVAHGRVAVRYKGAKLAELMEGQRVTVYTESGRYNAEAFNPENVDWHYSMIVLPRVRLEDAAEILEKRFNVHVKIANEAMKNCVIEASYPKDASLDFILNSFCTMSRVGKKPTLLFTIEQDTVTLSGSLPNCLID
ncbi:FecR domain-containing protein [Fulvivirgaceae bacterium PWU5]|uniref:FecR domain-containing protein n=1 Tax=Dawidia cretensis TaxID=2782350 RepID=A0AAP2GTP3_9BACT|nr:FecR domain-containing protein [Dawidia cretensis]MBT1707715.1 FecR domain-containing protein [Dawidia cretensis]